ncbi:MAG: hypothetical protein IPJ75_04625 [Ignavibacteriales bacterium]|nr:hypothetical protein [Ignavibacteriales bacterium]
MKQLLLSFLVVSGLFFTTFAQPELSTRMHRALQNTNSDEYVKGIIFLRDQVDVMKLDEELYKRKATPSERSEAVITALGDQGYLNPEESSQVSAVKNR